MGLVDAVSRFYTKGRAVQNLWWGTVRGRCESAIQEQMDCLRGASERQGVARAAEKCIVRERTQLQVE